MELSFYGAAKDVTGVNFLLTGEKVKILVDCGLVQGSHFFNKQNFQDFGYKSSEIDYLFVSHAHIDHVGRIPKLYKDGFRGKILCSYPTRDLAEVSLTDGYRVMEEAIKRVGGQPLYSPADIDAAMELFHPVEYNKKFKLSGDLVFRMQEAGHILGSSITEIWLEGQKIVFSGDLGNSPPPMIRQTAVIDEADYLVIESAYGDRNHPDVNERKLLLERTMEDVATSKGVLMIPVAAVEKAQELLFEMNELIENNRVPRIPIFLDSPLADKITQIYEKYHDYLNDEAKKLISSGDSIFHFPGLKFTSSKEES
ncbi:MBL fold metallo-hydrolase, partial [Candidatus Uhrbacteria bacterium]|nr:MBL fold metallo-hydrolase [Candidatus Uhrbacteria bacterium]